MEIETAAIIIKHADKIQKAMMKDKFFSGCEMNRMKIMMDDNEATFSFTKKGHRSALSRTTKEYWKE